MHAEFGRLLAGIGSVHRRRGLLDLQKKRIAAVIAKQHHAPGPKTHAAHAHHPVSHIGHRIALQHEAALRRQGIEIVVQAFGDALTGRGIGPGEHRRLVDEAMSFDLVMAGHALQQRRIVGLPGFFLGLAEQDIDLCIRRPFGRHIDDQFRNRGPALPQREHRHGGAAMHHGPIAGHRTAHRMRSLRRIKTDFASCHFDARGEPL